MAPISLTTFVDFVNAAGSPKMTIVRDWKHGDPYDPRNDFWKKLRDAMVSIHEDDRDPATLDSVVKAATPKKHANYSRAATGYRKWLGKRTPSWTMPPKLIWKSNGVAVRVNPELGLKFGSTVHFIKLYFKDDKLPANRAALILQMMYESSDGKLGETQLSLLDVGRSRLHTWTAAMKSQSPLLLGEAAYWAAIYPKL